MLPLSLYKEFKDTNKHDLNIHVLRVVFLELVRKLACNARLPAVHILLQRTSKERTTKVVNSAF